MQGRQRDGIAWMRADTDAWSRDSFFCVHNWWHLALYHLDLGEIDEVLSLFDGPIYGARSKVVLDMVDASGPPAPKPADAIRALVPPAVSAPAPAAAVCEWETAVARVGGHPEVLKRLVPLLAQRTPGLLTAAHTAIAQHDSPALRQALHTLQGSVGIFVAQAALEAAQRLDALGRQEDWPQAEIAYAHLVREVAQLEHALRAVL